MRVDLLAGSTLVQADETMQEVVASRVVVVTTSVIREVVAQRRVRELLGEHVDLVQEQDLERECIGLISE